MPLASGAASVLGLDPVRHRDQVRRRVGLLSHASHLYDDLTVAGERAVRRAGRRRRHRPDRRACERLGLTGRLLKTSAAKLSAGQRRRVALAVLAARWPELWLLDEPHAGLDASARATLDELIARGRRGRGHRGHRLPRGRFVESLAARAVTVTGGRVTAERPLGPGAGASRADADRHRPPCRRVDRRGGGPCGVTPLLVAGKDLRIEARSRVAPVPGGPVRDRGPGPVRLRPRARPHADGQGAPGLFWVAVLFCTVLAVQRSVSVESVDGARDGLRLSGLDPAGLFLGKSAAVAAQLVVLEVVLGVGVVLLYGARIEVPWLIVVSCLLGTVGLAATGTLYGALSAGLRVRETLLPFLFLPIAAPVLLAGTRIWQAALAGGGPADGTPWLRLLVVFDAVYLALGVVVFGPIQESA